MSRWVGLPDSRRTARARSWRALQDLGDSLPAEAKKQAFEEQYLLAVANLGDPTTAIARLREMNRRFGDTPERLGIIGGRYKRLYRSERDRRVAAAEPGPSPIECRYLNAAVESYAAGMRLDLNEYYCSSNLPGLLRDRGYSGDAERADAIELQVLEACLRAKGIGSQDPYLDATLFGAAFRRGEVEKLERLADAVELDPAAWRLASLAQDAADWIRHAPDHARPALEDVLVRLRAAAGV